MVGAADEDSGSLDSDSDLVNIHKNNRHEGLFLGNIYANLW